MFAELKSYITNIPVAIAHNGLRWQLEQIVRVLWYEAMQWLRR